MGLMISAWRISLASYDVFRTLDLFPCLDPCPTQCGAVFLLGFERLYYLYPLLMLVPCWFSLETQPKFPIPRFNERGKISKATAQITCYIDFIDIYSCI